MHNFPCICSDGQVPNYKIYYLNDGQCQKSSYIIEQTEYFGTLIQFLPLNALVKQSTTQLSWKETNKEKDLMENVTIFRKIPVQ